MKRIDKEVLYEMQLAMGLIKVVTVEEAYKVMAVNNNKNNNETVKNRKKGYFENR